MTRVESGAANCCILSPLLQRNMNCRSAIGHEAQACWASDRIAHVVEEYREQARRRGGLILELELFDHGGAATTGMLSYQAMLLDALANDPRVQLVSVSSFAELSVAAERQSSRERSVASGEEDLQRWLGNRMQQRAFAELVSVYQPCRDRGGALLESWRELSAAQHFEYMATKTRSSDDEYSEGSPYESPYEAFINYMSVLADVRARISRSDSRMAATL